MPDRLQEALRLLPHGPAFRFIDRLLHLEPGHKAVATYKVRGDEPSLQGHFPGNPLFPGVLLVEAAAQLAGIAAQSSPNNPPLQGLKLTALRSVKILGTAKPGETIQLEAEIVGRLAGLIQARSRATVKDDEVLRAEIVLAGSPSQAEPF